MCRYRQAPRPEAVRNPCLAPSPCRRASSGVRCLSCLTSLTTSSETRFLAALGDGAGR
ncbi:hypothetical protein CCHR01_05019 [Colletotrichum chrysophilum]|uniref:Uncharacterized protein n=1 Tax=Colletotrichum chrysophilum TaxID=1836956 RepID=A0AAD9ARY0_9PEZI|nr:hypothetical protein CCHR01_05019 [Colletotrichum chrysophilum]